MSMAPSNLQFAGMRSLQNISEVINQLSMQISILEDERDEYKRKWLDEVEAKQQVISQNTNS